MGNASNKYIRLLADLFTRVRLHPCCQSSGKQPNKASTPLVLVVLALADSFFGLDQGIVSEKPTQGKFLIQPVLSPRKLAVGRDHFGKVRLKDRDRYRMKGRSRGLEHQPPIKCRQWVLGFYTERK